MKKLITVLFALILTSISLSAQRLPGYSEDPISEEAIAAWTPSAYSDGATQKVESQLSKAEKQLKTGKALLISAGSLTVAGVGLYGTGLLAMGDGNAFASTCTISGIACAGTSIGLYIAGTVMYLKGDTARKRLSVTPNGIALNF